MNQDRSSSDAASTRHVETMNGLRISPELFEKLFLSPQNKVKGDLRQTLAVPTPLALVGFTVALTPLSIDLMGWRGSGGLGAASVPAYYFFGGMLLEIAAVIEFLLGNTFPLVVFAGYGSWFLTFGATLQPIYNASGAYSPDPTKPGLGAQQPAFLASFGFQVLTMAVLSLMFLVCSLRTNAVFVIIFIGATLGFATIAGGLLYNAEGNITLGGKLIEVGGGCFLAASLAGWYLLLSIMLAILDFPISLPVFDLSNLIKGGSETNEKKTN